MVRMVMHYKKTNRVKKEEMKREKLFWLVEISHALWTLKRYDSFQVDLSNQSLSCIRKQIKHMDK